MRDGGPDPGSMLSWFINALVDQTYTDGQTKPPVTCSSAGQNDDATNAQPWPKQTEAANNIVAVVAPAVARQPPATIAAEAAEMAPASTRQIQNAVAVKRAQSKPPPSKPGVQRNQLNLDH